MKKILLLTLVSSLVIIFSCNKGVENYDHLVGEIIKEWKITLRNSNINPSPANRTDTGSLILQLTDKNHLTYQYNVTDLQNGDFITGAALYAGGPLTNGQRLLDLEPRATAGYASRTIYDVRQSLVDSLLSNTAEIYILLTSTQHPNGVVRAQLNSEVVFAMDLPLSGANEVPAVTTTATGVASLRLTNQRILYSRVTVTNMEPTDMATMAHIHVGAPGVNGPILVGLVSSPAEFGVTKMIQVSDSVYNRILNDRLYVNVHSTLFPAGKIRGQIR